jgi:hypothetical protein
MRSAEVQKTEVMKIETGYHVDHRRSNGEEIGLEITLQNREKIGLEITLQNREKIGFEITVQNRISKFPWFSVFGTKTAV